MARKRLIKGANAARVEERIARVPADVPSPAAGQGASIFGALRTMEAGKPAERGPAPRSPAPRKPAARKAKPPAPRAQRGGKAVPEPKPAPVSPARPAAAPPRPRPLSPSDFNSAEREAIVRCCSDYRNHLPTYLIAVQKEVRVIDSVIDKCLASKGKPSKG